MVLNAHFHIQINHIAGK